MNTKTALTLIVTGLLIAGWMDGADARLAECADERPIVHPAPKPMPPIGVPRAS